jgi:DNA-binding XRE family transcriptional regulator
MQGQENTNTRRWTIFGWPLLMKEKLLMLWLENKILTPAKLMKLMTRDQCRAARTLLHMTQPQLAKKAHCSLTTLVNYELNRRYVTDEMIQSIQRALEKAGAIFINGNGVRLKRIQRNGR